MQIAKSLLGDDAIGSSCRCKKKKGKMQLTRSPLILKTLAQVAFRSCFQLKSHHD